MFAKVLVANRGEIAVRAFRAAYELGRQTVAVFPWEDRNSVHRLKADESYQIGEEGHPVRAYLSVDEVVGAARRAGADAVYPGYGFLSENPDLAAACARAGITFVGPPASVLELTGNKARAIAAARDAGLPVLASTEPSADLDTVLASTADMPVPGVRQGGGRRRRARDARVADPGELAGAVQAAMREAESAFGDATVFVEQAVVDPRHIEVQILADGAGDVVHLFERDCSVQRRHQKVVELAPAPNLDPALRERICADAVAFARAIGYVNAGTVEFLLDASGRHVFIEMNPRIQVEHTVTEEVTDVDLVQSQLRIAAGETLADLGLSQESIVLRGAALQCRITTEDPANGFRPDTGRITAYRSPGGAGIRLDGGASLGAEVEAHFDSLLVKLTCRGRTFDIAVARARRAVAEFRIRGVATNIPFLAAVLDDPDFAAGRVTTSFIEQRPALLTARSSADRGTRLLTYLADVTVNQPHGERPHLVDPVSKLPAVDLTVPAAGGLPGPASGAGTRAVRRPSCGGRWRWRSPTPPSATPTSRCWPPGCAPGTCWPSRGTWPAPPRSCCRWSAGAGRPTTWRCGSCTRTRGTGWRRCARRCPNVCLQMLLRGRNTVGLHPLPRAGHHTVRPGGRGHRHRRVSGIFDALNDVAQMRPAIDAVRGTGTAVAEVALCYTGDLSDPARTSTRWTTTCGLAEQIVDAGAHVLAIKDMAGLLRPPGGRDPGDRAARSASTPRCTCTPTTPPAASWPTLLAAWHRRGGRGGRARWPPWPAPPASRRCRRSSRPPTPPGGPPAWSWPRSTTWSPTGRRCAGCTRPFESGLAAPTGRVYRHEIPGGQLSNLRQQAIALGLGQRFEEVEDAYAAADRLLGRLVKVTPSSKVVGDLALQLVGSGVSVEDFAAEPARSTCPTR
jgi:pyruvate carboxylase